MPIFSRILFPMALSLATLKAQTPADLYRITDAATTCHIEFHDLKIPKGGEVVLAEFSGPGKISYLYLTDDSVGKWDPGLVLKIYWDDSKEPSILAPLADFFGAIGGKAVDYSSAAMQINHACFMCYLPMPFSRHARIVLANDGEGDYARKIAYGVDCEQSPVYANENSRLHCEWHRSNPVKDGLHTLLDISNGHGQYVGSFLQAVSKTPGIWFGEGDTIFQLDGHALTHSPGSEDEYGSCWEDPHWRTFASPACGHVLNENGVNRMYRWYLANPVRFREALKVQIQNQHDNGRPTTAADADDYTSVAFWYQEGSHAAAALPSMKERTAASFASGK